MNQWILGLLSVLCMLPMFAWAGSPLKGTKAIRQVNPAAVQRAVAHAVAPVQALRISNISGKPRVRLEQMPLAARSQYAGRLVPASKVYKLFFPKNTTGSFSAGKMFVPRGLLGPEKAVYRGMSLQLPELKNLLIQGLEPRKSHTYRKVYTALEPVIALTYANPAVREKKEAFPVLVKIPFIPALQPYAPNMLKDMKLGNLVFERDLPARFISDVWVFLEVNGRPDWYKAVLEEDELIFLLADGELRNRTEGLTLWTDAKE